jgi:hypothetical protein
MMNESESPPKNRIDEYIRLAVVVLLFGWNWLEGAIFENEYPKAFVQLYSIPLWRAVLLLLLVLGAKWCYKIGYLLAFFIFFYVMDMEVTLEKWMK